jgi:hypothetical protein
MAEQIGAMSKARQDLSADLSLSRRAFVHAEHYLTGVVDGRAALPSARRILMLAGRRAESAHQEAKGSSLVPCRDPQRSSSSEPLQMMRRSLTWGSED